MRHSLPRRSLPVLFACILWHSAASQDPTKDIRSKDPEIRLSAIAALHEGEEKNAERLLIGALRDKDWEVRQRAASALVKHVA